MLESFGRLRAAYDLVFVEGAGSASEINLRANDIANMGFAQAAGLPVVLVGDIDRGGVIASLVGTKHVLAPADAALIEGFIVNKMRGDPSLFADGMAAIAQMTGWRALGLVPHFAGAGRLPAEDALALRPSPPPSPPGRGSPAVPVGQAFPLPSASACGCGYSSSKLAKASLLGEGQGEGSELRIAVPLLPFISNFDDLDPLRLEPGVSVEMIPRGLPLPAGADVVLLPGSKATIADLETFRAEGWDIDLAAHVRRGGRVLGLCGGFQMLGAKISDPDGIEGPPRSRARPWLSRFRDGAHGPEDAASRERLRLRRAVRRLRDACGRKHRWGAVAAVPALRGWPSRGRRERRWPRRGMLRAWAFRFGRFPPGLARDVWKRSPPSPRPSPRGERERQNSRCG